MTDDPKPDATTGERWRCAKCGAYSDRFTHKICTESCRAYNAHDGSYTHHLFVPPAAATASEPMPSGEKFACGAIHPERQYVCVLSRGHGPDHIANGITWRSAQQPPASEVRCSDAFCEHSRDLHDEDGCNWKHGISTCPCTRYRPPAEPSEDASDAASKAISRIFDKLELWLEGFDQHDARTVAGIIREEHAPLYAELARLREDRRLADVLMQQRADDHDALQRQVEELQRQLAERDRRLASIERALSSGMNKTSTIDAIAALERAKRETILQRLRANAREDAADSANEAVRILSENHELELAKLEARFDDPKVVDQLTVWLAEFDSHDNREKRRTNIGTVELSVGLFYKLMADKVLRIVRGEVGEG